MGEEHSHHTFLQLVTAALTILSYEQGQRAFPVALMSDGYFVVPQEMLRPCCTRWISKPDHVDTEGVHHLMSPLHLAEYYGLKMNDLMTVFIELKTLQRTLETLDNKESGH